jgi:hypothetical protein
MPDLHDTQQLFWAAIRWPTGVRNFLAQADEETRTRFEATFEGNEALDAVERMEVYANAYFWRLFGVLEKHFATVAWLAGPEAFNDLVTDYVLERPSKDPDLSKLGAPFPAYLAEHPLGREQPALVSVARVERARIALLDAADHPVAGVDDLRALPPASWPALRFRISPNARLIPTAVDVAALWSARAEGKSPRELDPELFQHEGRTLVWRRGHAVIHRSTGPRESLALEALWGGGSFLDLCTAVADAHGPGTVHPPGPDPSELVDLLRGWLGAHLIAEIDRPTSP